MDRISIDLIGGLPENDSGYTGILIITEALSKYPWFAPIRSKEASEIAAKLLEFICIFGPPKIIVLDQGTEFCNRIVIDQAYQKTIRTLKSEEQPNKRSRKLHKTSVTT